jgi:hypothetical protein
VARGYKAIWRGGKLIAEYDNGVWTYHAAYEPSKRSDTVAAPMLIKDIGEYVSPLDGQHITSRSQHRDHMRAHEVVEVGNDRLPRAPDVQKVDRDLGMAIKRRYEEVVAMPQAQYDDHIATQRAEHQAIGELATPTV